MDTKLMESADDLLDDLDLWAPIVEEPTEAMMAALDAVPNDGPDDPIVPAPLADWLVEVRALAQKHGPFATWQVVQIIRELGKVIDPADGTV
jgi:hypothetical protein